MKNLLRSVLSRLGYGVVTGDRLRALIQSEQLFSKLLAAVSTEITDKLDSHSQIYQDVFVLLATDFKRGGYFVEFGATNGKDLSNTYLLEKQFGWQGLLAEPAQIWHAELSRNRSCNVEFDCVWSHSGMQLEFNIAAVGEHSGIADCLAGDRGAPETSPVATQQVKTISLLDMLVKHKAPQFIDYLSIDTEGSELAILAAFDFSRYQIAIIHVEHNYQAEQRTALFELLTKQGYTRRYENFSKWDDWYYREDLLPAL